jgi:putative ABC transport system permease protein
MTGLRRDLQQAIRSLHRQPTFAAVAVLTLALGFGATTAVFSVVNAVVLRSLPFPDSERLVLVFESNRAKGWTTFSVAPGNFADWARESRSFDSMSAVSQGRSTLTGTGGPEQVPSTSATAEYFRVLRVPAALGRGFQSGDDAPGAAPVVVISHGLWHRRFGGREDIVGQRLEVDGVAAEIVGVMPADFGAPAMDVWRPLTIDRHSGERGGRGLLVVGRLADGQTIESADREMNLVGDRLASAYPAFNAGWGVNLVRLEEATVGRGVRRALYILLGAAALLLLIACVNVANLQSVRALARGREMAIRAALGASRWRLTRQLLVESLVLAAAGGLVGLFVTVWGRDALLALTPSGLPRVHEVDVDGRVLAVGAVLVLSAAVIFGLLPGLRATRVTLDQTLRGGARSTTPSISRMRAGSALVVVEIALSFVLLAGAGLLMRSFLHITARDPGFTPAGVLTFQLSVPQAAYPRPEDVNRYLDQLRERLRGLPGVVAVGGTHALPFTAMNSVRPFIREGVDTDTSDPPVSDYRLITPGYMAALGVAIRRGREFSDDDLAGRPAAVVVNEAFASRFLKSRDPLGQRLRQAGDNPQIPWMTVVGVVADVRHSGLLAPPQPEMYWVHSQATWGDTLNRVRRNLSIVVRTSGDAAVLVPLVRARLLELDPNVAISTPRSMESLISTSTASPRFNTVLMIAFAGLGLVLAIAGVYGVVSFGVERRMREFGIRLALGATPRELLRRVVIGGGLLAATGLAAGAIAAALLVDLLRSQLVDVPPRDVTTFTVVAMVLLASTLAASYLPARRGARVAPTTALRDD